RRLGQARGRPSHRTGMGNDSRAAHCRADAGPRTAGRRPLPARGRARLETGAGYARVRNRRNGESRGGSSNLQRRPPGMTSRWMKATAVLMRLFCTATGRASGQKLQNLRAQAAADTAGAAEAMYLLAEIHRMGYEGL